MRGRKFKIGHLFFKYVQGTQLEKTEFNTSKKLAQEMSYRKIITLYTEAGDGLEETDNAGRATWYAYNVGMEPTKPELVALLTR